MFYVLFAATVAFTSFCWWRTWKLARKVSANAEDVFEQNRRLIRILGLLFQSNERMYSALQTEREKTKSGV